MIKYNELRPGNWLSYEDDGGWTSQKVNFVAKDLDGFSGWFVDFGWASVTLEDFFADGTLHVKPLSITDHWLTDFGFKHIGPDDYLSERWVKEGFDYIYSCGSFCQYSCEGSAYGPAYFGKVDFVHQFQNLYFALTGEEI